MTPPTLLNRLLPTPAPPRRPPPPPRRPHLTPPWPLLRPRCRLRPQRVPLRRTSKLPLSSRKPIEGPPSKAALLAFGHPAALVWPMTRPSVAPSIAWEGDVLRSTQFDDLYHSSSGGLAE